MDNRSRFAGLRVTCGREAARGAVTMTLLAFVSMAGVDASASAAMQDDQAAPVSAAPGDGKRELAELGETLKAAVLSGTLSEEDAIRIYEIMARDLETENAKKALGAARDRDGPYAAKLDLMLLSPPRPGEIRELFQPEFRRRDLQLLRHALDLDQSQMVVIEALLGDYLEAFDLASTPFREALDRYRRASADQWLAAALDRADVDQADVAVRNTRAALRRLARESRDKVAVDGASSDRATTDAAKRAARRSWERRMISVTATMEDRLATLRERVQTRRAEMERAGSTVTADDLVRMARELRDDRARLRTELTDFLELIVFIEPTEADRARFDAVIARLRVEHVLEKGRLGGESMNLRAALNETSRDDGIARGRTDGLLEAEAFLGEREPRLAATLDQRTEATLDRELRGLEFLAERDRIMAATGEPGDGIDPARQASALRPFADASRREVAASVAVRDELLELLDDSCGLMDAAAADASDSRVYREAALRRGFRTEMRQRWSERALREALRLEDLDEASRAAVAALASDVAAVLWTLRADAIAERIRRDPERALEHIEAQIDGRGKRGRKFDLEELLGSDPQVYAALDERTEDQLRTLLTPEQFATMPSRPRAIKGGKGAVGDK